MAAQKKKEAMWLVWVIVAALSLYKDYSEKRVRAEHDCWKGAKNHAEKSCLQSHIPY